MFHLKYKKYIYKVRIVSKSSTRHTKDKNIYFYPLVMVEVVLLLLPDPFRGMRA